MIIKIDTSNVFNTTCRALAIDVLSGHASRDYACGLKRGEAIESTSETLSNMCGYFHAMRTCHAKLRYLDWDGQVQLAKGKTGGQQGGALEMLLFNLTTLYLWGHTLAKYPQSRALVYSDDGYIKVKMSVALQALADLQHVVHVDAGLDLNVPKTSVLPKGITHQAVFDTVQNIINSSPTLDALSGNVSPVSFCPEGFVGIGVPIGT